MMISTATYFKALSDETRLRILNLLLTHDLCVGALAGRLGISKAAVSQHLKVLRNAGLVRGEKRGYWTHYGVQREALRELAGELREMSDRRVGDDGYCLRSLPLGSNNQKGRRVLDMCNDCCQHPEKLKGKPEDCTPEQIKECHGDTKEHPCTTEKK